MTLWQASPRAGVRYPPREVGRSRGDRMTTEIRASRLVSRYADGDEDSVSPSATVTWAYDAEAVP